MYSRRLGDRTLSFGHEGILYKNSFVMYDKQTGSLWVHTTGQAVRGQLQGQQLRFLPSAVTTWGKWRSQHPDTLALTGRRAEGMMGSFNLNRDRQRYGLSVGYGKRVKLFPFSMLPKDGVHNDEVDGRNVVVVVDGATGMGAAFERGDRVFREKDGRMVDQDGQAWDRQLGTSGERRLIPVPATPWLIDRWMAFFRPQQQPSGQSGPGQASRPPPFPEGQPPARRLPDAFAAPGNGVLRVAPHPPRFPPGFRQPVEIAPSPFHSGRHVFVPIHANGPRR